MPTAKSKQDSQLVDGPTLLKEIFPPSNRPTLRWLREQQKNRTIPYIKISRLVFFDPVEVRQHLEKNHKTKAVA
jgi:hypothetical protein